MNKPVLILVRGLPGAGKSTLAKLLGWPTYEADDYFYDAEEGYKFDANKLHEAHLYCQINARITLSKGSSCVVSNTSTTDQEIKVYQDIADQFDALFITLIVENRHNGKSIHAVPDSTLIKMKERFNIRL